MTGKHLPAPRRRRAQLRRKRYTNLELNLEFYRCIEDIVYHPVVLRMKRFYQHCDTDCYQHCLSVAYYNFRICKALQLDARSAARGGMLHDLFLYDWRTHSEKTGDRLHAMTHPWTAYRNAKKYFKLNSIEKEVLTKHMWPTTLIPPRHWETYVICFTDKYCGSAEILEYYSQRLEKYRLLRPLGKKLGQLCTKISGIHQVLESQDLLVPSPEAVSMEKAANVESFAQQRRRRGSSWGRSSSGRKRRALA